MNLRLINQDVIDEEKAMLRAHARLSQGLLADVDINTMRFKSIEELTAEELLKIRLERVEKQAEAKTLKAKKDAELRGIVRATQTAATPSPEAGDTHSKTVSVPTDERIEERNDRWLAHYETEVRTALYGAYTRGAAHFNEERSKYRKAVVRARERRAIKYRDDIKSVSAKAGAMNWGSQLVSMGKKTKGTKP